jgi:HPr kinase/phosphorylase
MTKFDKGVAIKKIIDQKDLEIVNVYNKKWTANLLFHPRIQKPGLALAGYLKYLNKQRLQIFGKTEMGYLNQLSPPEREKHLKNFFSLKVPGVIISENQAVDDKIISWADKYKTPVLVSSLKASLLVSRISSLLYQYFSKKIRINGVLIDILGLGVLITGDSGIGKSETALELVNKGHHLVSDDLIEFYLDSNDQPVGRSIERIQKWLEVRGLGIINIADIFGVGALLPEKKLDLVIQLEKWSSKKQYDRLGEEKLYFNILEKEIPRFILPVAPGRNLSTLIEVAAKYFISRKYGSKSFIEHIYKNEKAQQ